MFLTILVIKFTTIHEFLATRFTITIQMIDFVEIFCAYNFYPKITSTVSNCQLNLKDGRKKEIPVVRELGELSHPGRRV